MSSKSPKELIDLVSEESVDEESTIDMDFTPLPLLPKKRKRAAPERYEPKEQPLDDKDEESEEKERDESDESDEESVEKEEKEEKEKKKPSGIPTLKRARAGLTEEDVRPTKKKKVRKVMKVMIIYEDGELEFFDYN